MKHSLKRLLICAGMCLSMGAMAAPDIDEITLDVMTSNKDLPDAVKEKIELPEHASETAKEASKHGIETANQHRDRDRDRDRERDADHDKGELAEHKEEAKDHKDDVEDHKTDVEDHKIEIENHTDDHKTDTGSGSHDKD